MDEPKFSKCQCSLCETPLEVPAYAFADAINPLCHSQKSMHAG